MISNYIAIDWGSSNLRAWRYRNGSCIDHIDLACGITRLGEEKPADAFNRLFSIWREDNTVPTIMAGMIGSNAGWRTVPYLPCPTDLNQLSQHLYHLETKLAIVPGLQLQQGDRCDVMRGEETQILGAMREAPASLFVLPGTHSKWAVADSGRVCEFSTVMTGELHHLLMAHALLGRDLPGQQEDRQAFTDGLTAGIHQPAILPQLFEARAARLLGHLASRSVSEWLSGLLIGAETAQMCTRYQPSQVTLIASNPLQQRYQCAFEQLGVTAHSLTGEHAFQSGIRKIIDDMAW